MAEPLKEMFNAVSVQALAGALGEAATGFDERAFVDAIFDDAWDGRALKRRMRHITLAMGRFLPPIYRDALSILLRAVPSLPELGFEKMVFPDFVEVYGQDEVRLSLNALEIFTQHVSAEFAIRPFIARYQGRTMEQMLVWSEHEHDGVRRLASEGCRPRLPWGMALPALKADPSPIMPILDNLKADSSESVRRSVANNFNDISKEHPELVVETFSCWRDGASPEMKRLISHGLRTLLKQGHPGALALLGYPPNPAVELRNLTISPGRIAMGEEVTISFEIVSLAAEPLNLMVDYVLGLVRARGKRSAKVFKLRKLHLGAGKSIIITKRQSFQPISTRRYYPGEHTVHIQINGTQLGSASFVLVEPGGA